MSWHAKATGGYARTSNEAIENAREMYSILRSRGWTLNAVCGMLGNIGHESVYNPWRWQNDNIGTPTSGNGYGLVQWTPADHYISNSLAESISGYAPNYSGHAGDASDGRAQTIYINYNNVNGGAQYSINRNYNYRLTWTQFKKSTATPAYLAKAWLHNFERPADQSTSVENVRAEEANYWYRTLSGSEPPEESYSITVNVSGNGTAYATPSTATAGTTITLHEQPNGTDTFTGFTVVSGDITISTDYTFTMPDSDVIITAEFSGETPPEPEPEKVKRSKWIYYMRPAWTLNM